MQTTSSPSSIIAVSFGSGALVSFIILVITAKLHLCRFTKFDITLTHWVRNFHPHGKKFFINVDKIGNIFGLACVVACLVGGLYLSHHHLAAMWLGLSVFAVAGIINPLLKLLIQRQRPQVTHLVHALGYSFPSGHASGSMIIFGTLMTIIPGLNLPVIWFVLAQVSCLLLIIIIGFSRIYLGVHYTIDVLAGYLEGLAWIGLTYPIFIHYLA